VPRVGYPDPDTFASSYALLTEWLDALPFERIVLGGFSQGAVMAYAAALGEGRPRPDALVAFSGFIPAVEGWRPNLEPPFPRVGIAHGTYDPVISVELGRRARDTLAVAGAEVLYRESPIDHSIDPAVVDEFRALVA